MSINEALNIFITIIILAVIVSLAWWVFTQVVQNPVIRKWAMIIGALLLLFVLVTWLTGGIHTYPFLR